MRSIEIDGWIGLLQILAVYLTKKFLSITRDIVLRTFFSCDQQNTERISPEKRQERFSVGNNNTISSTNLKAQRYID